MKLKYIVFAMIFFVAGSLNAQNLTLPQLSPEARVEQTVGLAKVAMEYHRPSVKNRHIWGGLVPYDEVWRAGANENTIFELSHDAKINGEELKAGKYGFHIIPSEGEWILVFNYINSAWGSFFYNPKKDALRINATPAETNFHETLTYTFSDVTEAKTNVNMFWEKLVVSFTVEFNSNEIVLNSFRNELVSRPGFFWNGFYQAAEYCANNDINHEEALDWVNQSIQIQKNFQNMMVKSTLLSQTGKKEEAKKVEDEAFEMATEQMLNTYGYKLLQAGDYKSALNIFMKNSDKNPDSWNVYDSLGECFSAIGKPDEAYKNYKKALDMAPEAQKERIKKQLEKLSDVY